MTQTKNQTFLFQVLFYFYKLVLKNLEKQCAKLEGGAKGKDNATHESEFLSELEGPYNFHNRQFISIIIQGNKAGEEKTPHGKS